MKHPLIFTFYTRNDYNSYIIKICLFLFSFSLSITINALFFSETTIHQIYNDEGIFNFIYQIPQILYSLIISSTINTIISFFSLTEKTILKLKNDKNKTDMKKSLNIKFCFFFVFSFLFLILFWFYLGCFCAVYKNSQIHLIKDTLIGFGLGLIYPFGINLITGIFRIVSLKNAQKNMNYLFNISKILQLI